jgi:hypothetical protein
MAGGRVLEEKGLKVENQQCSRILQPNGVYWFEPINYFPISNSEHGSTMANATKM